MGEVPIHFGKKQPVRTADSLIEVPNLHPDYTVRRGTPDDVDAIMAFIGQVFHDTYGELGDQAFPPRQGNIRKDVEAAIQHPDHRKACFFLVTDKATGEIAATLAVRPEGMWGSRKNQAKLSSVFTSRNHQQKGLSSALLDHALKHLKAVGIQSVFFSTWEKHVNAHRMYEKREAVLIQHANEQFLMAFFIGQPPPPVHLHPSRGPLAMHQYPTYLLNTVI